MPRIIPVGFGEASIILTGGPGTAPYVTTIGINLNGVAPEDIPGAANDIQALYFQAFGDLISDQVNIDKVSIAVGLAGGTSGSVDSTTGPLGGGQGSEMEPLSMAPIARKVTADLGRSGRGRCFLPCMLRRGDVSESGNLAVATLQGLNERWDDFLVGMATLPVGGAVAPVLLHNDGSTPSPIIGGAISSKVGWIRKRIR